MSDDVIRIILSKLDKIEVKQDRQAAQLTQICERLAAIETRQEQQEKINEEVAGLQELKDKGAGVKSTLAMIGTGVIAVISLAISWLK